MTFISKNVGGLDRKLRLIIGPILLVLGILAALDFVDLNSIVQILFLVVGSILTFTGTVQTCPLNAALRVNTHKAEST
ncbi:MAG: DUF2892 domain-containing protein [Candidatus Heimdallarchaeota archaeon]|nr:DUF2892 domain-containing protein [Candidatus Heimdallarchaeota archaeon]